MKNKEKNEVGMHTYVFTRSRIVTLLDFVEVTKTKLAQEGRKIGGLDEM
jgi:hypothetical protein